MPKRKTNPASWSAIKARLKKFPATALLGIIQDLHDLTPENHAFLHARFAPVTSPATLKPFLARVKHPFHSIHSELNFRDARKAIRDYKAATSDLPGTLDLMLTFVEAGNRYTRTFGDIDERFYNALISMIDKFAAEITPEIHRLYPLFAPRLHTLFTVSRGIGWGYSDDLGDILHALQSTYETHPPPAPPPP